MLRVVNIDMPIKS